MKNVPTKKQIGQRIAALRKSRGLSQAELARIIGIGRSSLVQLELGNRNLDFTEFRELSIALRFSLDDFMSDDYLPENDALQVSDTAVAYGERVSSPTLQVNKLKNVLLYLLEQCAGKPNIGETVLYKLLYFSDFNHYELYEEHMTGATYRKLPYGPVPQQLDAIIGQMIRDKQLRRVKVQYHGYPQTRYLPLTKADLRQIKASEKEVIDRVIAQMSDWSASAISEYSHRDMPWLATREGEEINYELAFYRELPFSMRSYEEDTERTKKYFN
jgi:transcriptional regulator with XRE-family HTH domain